MTLPCHHFVSHHKRCRMTSQTIELDADPFSPRPGDHIESLVKGTCLEGLPEAHPDHTVSRVFGCWRWAFPNVSADDWAEAQKIIRPRIEALYKAGLIRYGSW